ncbi:hypothetical protein EVAR_92351_1 [Eumeta japonica]|uniref:Uncharacterized protein n=1 Tax=Eumeta variegata TaxID=151549 RepID=A0A4C1TJR0_EUMVA|nr:hypothetical protein EVAR_92351_1 [Eumeta japonica]
MQDATSEAISRASNNECPRYSSRTWCKDVEPPSGIIFQLDFRMRQRRSKSGPLAEEVRNGEGHSPQGE